jgi:hypothetical protein
VPLEADVSEAGERRSGNFMPQAPDTGLAAVARIRQLLARKGFDAGAARVHSSNSCRERVHPRWLQGIPACRGGDWNRCRTSCSRLRGKLHS